jgi:ABC-type maltose transport system permease subunit
MKDFIKGLEKGYGYKIGYMEVVFAVFAIISMLPVCLMYLLLVKLIIDPIKKLIWK